MLPYLKSDYDISLFSSFKTKSRTRYFFDIHEHGDAEKLPEIAEFARTENIPLVIIGGGTNVLFAFDVFDGIIVRNHNVGWEEPFERIDRTYLRVNSGTQSHFVADRLYTHYQISTLVPWIGLPGTFGGATIGNAGCFGVEMADIFVEAEVLDLETGQIQIFSKENMAYTYRSSVLKGKEGFFVISTLIDLTPLGGEYESYTPDNLRSVRKVKQPTGFSCGSFFVNPVATPEQQEKLTEFLTPIGTLSAGRLIESVGLKGARIGGVKVSEQHANFFINDQKATWQDILALRDYVMDVVGEKYGISLTEEVRIIT